MRMFHRFGGPFGLAKKLYTPAKWRRKIPHGEYRLVFKVDAENDKVSFIHLGPREDDYKTAARRIKAMQKSDV